MFMALRRIHIFASDFPRSRRFYGETLGLAESGGFENDWVEFGLGPVLLKLTPLRPGEVPARNQVACVFSTADLDSAIGTLKEKGVTVTRPPADEFTGRSAEILDPDGYRLILFQPSELHPDEEWVPMSKVDEMVRHKVAARRQREKARGSSRPPAKKPAAKKPTPKKPTPKKPTPKKPARKARLSARKPAKKSASKKKATKKPAPKKAKKR